MQIIPNYWMTTQDCSVAHTTTSLISCQQRLQWLQWVMSITNRPQKGVSERTVRCACPLKQVHNSSFSEFWKYYNVEQIIFRPPQPTCKSNVVHNGQSITRFPVLDSTSATVIDKFETKIALSNKNVCRLRNTKAKWGRNNHSLVVFTKLICF